MRLDLTAIVVCVLLPLAQPPVAVSQGVPQISIQVAPPSVGTNFQVNDEASVTLTACSPSGSGGFIGQPTVWFNGEQQLGFWQSVIQSGCSSALRYSGAFTLTELGDNLLVVSAENTDGEGVAFESIITYPPAPIILPRAEAVSAPSGTTISRTFRIASNSDQPATYPLSYFCSGAVISCPPASGVYLPGFAARNVTISIQVSGGFNAPGELRVRAGTGSLADSMTYNVRVAPADPVIAEEECLSIGIGPESAHHCSDLLIAHSLPAVRTLGNLRSPILLYRGQHAHPRPVVATTVSFPAGAPRPDSVVARLHLGTLTPVQRSWPGTQWPAGDVSRRVAVTADADSLTSGYHEYALELRAYTGTGYSIIRTETGSVPIVNRSTSPFGAGWWIAGLERLVVDSTSLTWIGGDGSVRLYRATGTGSFVATPVTRPDSLLLRTNPVEYARILGGGDTVVFDGGGRHVRTTTRLGHTTTFTYDSIGRLSAVHVPPVAAQLSYGFRYANGALSEVDSPDTSALSSRVTVVSASGGRILALRDPADSIPVVFTYATTRPRLIETRTDRIGTTQRFEFDSAGRLAVARRAVTGGADTVVHQFVNAVSRSATAQDATAQPLDSVFTRWDGPRTDSADVHTFWLHRLGGVARLRNPYGDTTVVSRSDPRFGALKTRVRQPDGRVLLAQFDPRGNLSSITDSSGYGPGRSGARFYSWHQRWDEVVSASETEGPTHRYGVDEANGNRLWWEVGVDSTRRWRYHYYAVGSGAGQLRSVVAPGGARDSLSYDSRGNLSRYRTALGWTTETIGDRLGRTVVTKTPLDTGLMFVDSTRFDSRGRIERQVSTSTATPAASVVVLSGYDDEGRLLSVRRTQAPNPTGLDTLRTEYAYDGLGRRIAERAPDGHVDSLRYDLAGNLTRQRTRRGDTLVMIYDRLNRLRFRLIPAVRYAPRSQGLALEPLRNVGARAYPWFAEDTLIAADGETFGYDVMSRVVYAANGSSRVRRSYLPSGFLATDSLWIFNYAFPYADTRHVYGVALRYDLGGRVVAIKHPAQLAPQSPLRDSVRYSYDYSTGELHKAWDLLGNEFTFTYDARGQLIRLQKPGGIVDTLAYDVDGQVSLDRIRNGSTSAYKAPDAWLRSASVSYSGPGRLAAVLNSAGWKDTLRFNYDRLGQLSRNRFIRPTRPEWQVPQRQTVDQRFYLDPLGNAWSTVSQSASAFPVGGQVGQDSMPQVFDSATGRLTTTAQYPRGTYYVYDASGNEVFQWQTDAPIVGNTERSDRASFYDAAGRVRVAERRTARKPASNSNWVEAFWELTYEEYRYDALGRRIFVRERNDCPLLSQPSRCSIGLARRTVWAGNQELWEIQQPGTSLSFIENDTAAINFPRVVSDIPTFDQNPTYGRVGYLFAGGLDRPISITRLALVDRPANTSGTLWQPQTVIPSFNVRGQADIGTAGDGGVRWCTSASRCVLFNWRDRAWATSIARHQWQSDSSYQPFAWIGSLVTQKVDGVGTMYRRNRSVDAATGRFTQPDPIGLAGGLNLYGYASGDPINNWDPFGLSDCRKVKCPSIEKVAADPTVVKAGEEMFNASQVDGEERGAFLYNGPDGSIIVGPVVVGEAGTVNMGQAPDDAIGMLHTHPDLTAGRPGSPAIPGGRPSGDDHHYVRSNFVHGVVEQRNSTFYISWDDPNHVQRKPQSRAPRGTP